MAVAGDPRALGQLLRSRRERLAPADVGLPAGNRRRAVGLRREEVAALADLSTTYYTFLEQGRPGRPSEPVLEALATALRMTPAERVYLQTLAYGPPRTELTAELSAAHRAERPSGPGTESRAERGTAETGPAVEVLDPGVADLVLRLDPAPALVKGRRWDILAANPAARTLFTDWGAGPTPERNLVRWMFTSERAQQVYLDWEPEARAMLGRFRLAAARHPGDAGFAALIAHLHEESAHVRRWWPGHDVAPIGGGSKKLCHPDLGPTEYRHVVLQVADHPDQTLVCYTAEG